MGETNHGSIELKSATSQKTKEEFMGTRNFFLLGLKHTFSAFAEKAYLSAGFDATRPVSFYGLVNERCNMKCLSCPYWRQETYADEMSIEQWQTALRSVKDFVGRFSISFSGGEPLLKPGMIDLLAWCGKNGISAGITTNGFLLNQANVKRIVAAKPFNINLSLDAPNAALHNRLRGCATSFERATDGIRYLVEERRSQHISFPITIKPTVSSANFRLLPEMVQFAASLGGLSVSPQPIGPWTQEASEQLWIRDGEIEEFERVIEQLIAMRRQGAPILAPESALRLMVDHFRGKQAPRSTLPCRVGMRNFIIHTNGDVNVCYEGFPSIGNLREKSAREIWYSHQARKVRKATVQCEKLCLSTCVSQKTIFNKVGMAMRLLKSSRPV